MINDDTQIKKMKQRGNGNVATVTIDPENVLDDPVKDKTREEKRDERKAFRIERRLQRKEDKQAGSL